MYISERRFSTSSNIWLIGGILLVALVPIGTVGWVKWRERMRNQNERAAFFALVTVDQSELYFRADDKDRNGIQDYWTGDVAGLHSIQVDGQPIAILPRRLAEADAAPLTPLVPNPIPYQGYYLMALDPEEHKDPAEPSPKDRDSKSRELHNMKRYCFCAFPVGPETGDRVWIIVEGGKMFRSKEGVVVPPRSRPKDMTPNGDWEVLPMGWEPK
jgi:hypothetical protein